MSQLTKYGWNNNLSQIKHESRYNALSHGRISTVHRTCYEVVSDGGPFMCELAGSLKYGKSEFDLPCTGDWVIFQPFDECHGIVVEVFPRERVLYRKKSGTIAGKQAIASYVDKAFIVQSLDYNFNVRRAERFIAQIMEENIGPVLILNKADLIFDKQEFEGQVKHLSSQIPILFTSIKEPETVSQLQKFVKDGETVVFLGSSGVGKSSLVNALCGTSVLLTSDISQSTGKGRHTSTRSEMILMDRGGILIDTPGVREFGLAVENLDSFEAVMDISDYSKLCRFRDCKHVSEPGCAVIKAVNAGLLDRGVYESYLKLRREVWHFSASEHEKRKKDKSFAKLVGEVKRRKSSF